MFLSGSIVWNRREMFFRESKRASVPNMALRLIWCFDIIQEVETTWVSSKSRVYSRLSWDL